MTDAQANLEDDFDDDDSDLEEPGVEVTNACRCAECCRRLLVEAGLDDAEREPKIKERASPICMPADVTESGQEELVGYMLNRTEGDDDDFACVFLDQPTNSCTIYETRPQACRAFDCDGEGREQLIQLGYRPGRSPTQ